MGETITIDDHEFPILRGSENFLQWKRELMNYVTEKGKAYKRAIYGFSNDDDEENQLSFQMNLPSCSPQELYDAHHQLVEIIYLTLDQEPYPISIRATNANKLLNEIERHYST